MYRITPRGDILTSITWSWGRERKQNRKCTLDRANSQIKIHLLCLNQHSIEQIKDLNLFIKAEHATTGIGNSTNTTRNTSHGQRSLTNAASETNMNATPPRRNRSRPPKPPKNQQKLSTLQPNNTFLQLHVTALLSHPVTTQPHRLSWQLHPTEKPLCDVTFSPFIVDPLSWWK